MKIKISRAENRFMDVPLIRLIVKTVRENNVIPTKNIKIFEISDLLTSSIINKIM